MSSSWSAAHRDSLVNLEAVSLLLKMRRSEAVANLLAFQLKPRFLDLDTMDTRAG